MQFRAPGVIERRVFVALASAYAILTVAVLPWVAMPGPHAPEIIAVCNGGIALADICTALLLAREFLRGGRIAFLMLACAYAFGAAMAVVQALAFPGAIFDERAFGDLQTPAALFIGWRLGSAALFLAAVLNGQRDPVAPELAKRMLAYGLALTVAAVAAILVLSVMVDVPLIDAGRFTPWNRAAILA